MLRTKRVIGHRVSCPVVSPHTILENLSVMVRIELSSYAMRILRLNHTRVMMDKKIR